jgi:hypothetical protein
VYDGRSGVSFPENFRIFRTYKGRKYSAIALNHMWLRPDTGDTYYSLNQLNTSIVGGSENVWNAWKYQDDDGTTKVINALR